MDQREENIDNNRVSRPRGDEMKVKKVDVKRVSPPTKPQEFPAEFSQKCYFCEKTVRYNNITKDYLKVFNPKNRMYCTMCLRLGMHHRDSSNVLMLSFRGIIGHYYSYLYKNSNVISLSEIFDYITEHKKVGLTNPVFSYDEEYLNWFVDFNLVGTTKRKMRINAIYNHIINILICFELKNQLPSIQSEAFFKKYKDAIELFYKERKRPEGRKILCPTLRGCLAQNANHHNNQTVTTDSEQIRLRDLYYV